MKLAWDKEQKCRKTNSLYNKKVNKHWTAVFRIKSQFPLGIYQSALVMISQFLLRCAAAKTCHRCQGGTFQTAVVDCTGNTFAHAHYMALSSVTTLENVYIININEEKITVDNEWMNEWCFKARRQLRSFWALNNLLTVNDEIIKIEI